MRVKRWAAAALLFVAACDPAAPPVDTPPISTPPADAGHAALLVAFAAPAPDAAFPQSVNLSVSVVTLATGTPVGALDLAIDGAAVGVPIQQQPSGSWIVPLADYAPGAHRLEVTAAAGAESATADRLFVVTDGGS